MIKQVCTGMFAMFAMLAIGLPAKEVVIGGYTWKYDTSNTKMYVYDVTPKSGDIIVPNEIDGQTVELIYDQTFYCGTGIRSVVVPNGVAKIGILSFGNCCNLEVLRLPSSVTEMRGNTFDQCVNIKEVTLPGVICINASSVYTQRMFSYYDALYFPSAGSITNLTVSNGSKEVWMNTFKDFSSLQTVTIPLSVLKAGVNAFAGATNLEIVVAAGLPPSGLPESLLMQNYPAVTYPAEYESEWQEALAECSTNLVAMIDKGTNLIYSAGSSKTIIMSCDVDQASIYYTLDGTDPTTNSTKYTTKFKVKPQGKMTIKASAIIERWPYHSLQSITLAPGKCETPTASMADEEVFYESNQSVTLATTTEDCVIRYTLDGSEPTESSAAYVGPIVISETTTIKAKAFRDDYFESETMTVRLVRGWHQVATPVVRAATNGVATATFAGSHAWVELLCETDGATLHYTTDGSEPTQESPVYTQTFKVFESTTVKALAVKDDWLASAVAELVITKTYGIGDVMKDPDTTFVQDAVYPWTEDGGTAAFGESSMQSGAAGDDEASVLSATVTGSGRVLFRWKANCEEDVYDHEFDHGEFRVDGVEATDRIDGVMTNWKAEDLRVEGTGDHLLEWIYQKDEEDEKSYDGGRIWVDGFVWIPDDYSRTTQRTTAAVPHNWLYEYGLLSSQLPEAAVAGVTGKRDSTGRALTVEDDYVAGTDPTNVTSIFSASIEMTNGVPYVTWTPDLNKGGTKAIRSYQIWGSANLVNGGDWECPTNALHRFFKVTVEMP